MFTDAYSHIIKITRKLDEIQKALNTELTDLEIADLKLIGEGFRSIAIEADGQYIVLIGKHSKSSEAFLQDKVILPQIADLLPCEIPEGCS